MNVFIIWSGSDSRRIADALRKYIPHVMHATVFMSEEDIGKGQKWFTEISERLRAATFGIVCLTQENLTSIWIHFESGAIANRLESNKVSALLVGIDHSALQDPLRQFHHTKPLRHDVHKLFWEINKTLGTHEVAQATFEANFEVWWPKLEEEFMNTLQGINSRQSAAEFTGAASPTLDDIFREEVLYALRKSASDIDELKTKIMEISKRIK